MSLFNRFLVECNVCIKCVTNILENFTILSLTAIVGTLHRYERKSIDGVLGIWTWNRKMVGTDESTELWWPLKMEAFWVSPGLVGTREDSWSQGHGFESQHPKLDGHFSHTFGVKNLFAWKDEKEAGMAHLKVMKAFPNENCSQHSKVTHSHLKLLTS